MKYKPIIAITFSLLCAPSSASADLLGDLRQAIDLAKEVGNILPGGDDASTPPTPSPSPQPNPLILSNYYLIKPLHQM